MKKQADNIFTFGIGALLIVAANTSTAIWPLARWGISGLVIIGAIIAIVSFSGFSIFWSGALKRLDLYGPNCERHEIALKAYEDSVASVEPYKSSITFFISFAGSLTLMAGLLLQGWYIALGLEILGSAIGYGFIHYFQVNKFMILGQITGADEAAE